MQNDSTIERRPERQRGLANQIANARARRNQAIPNREEFMDEPVIETPDVPQPSHQNFREELRKIIADDAERAANEQIAPVEEVVEEIQVPVRKHSRLKIAAYWLGCLFGIGAVAYTLSRAN